MTKLNAIIRMLRSIGEQAPISLETGQPTDAGEAETILDEQNSSIQSRGWACNTIPERTYTPVGGSISIPSNVIRVTSAGESAHRKLAVQGTTLYDFDNDTATFTDPVVLKTILLLPFESLPDGLSHYVVASATAVFQRYKRRGVIDEGLMERDLMAAKVRAEQEDSDIVRPNFLQTRDAVAMRGGRPVYDNGTFPGGGVIWHATN